MSALAADPLDTNSTCQFAYDYYDGSYFYTRKDSCFVGSQVIEDVDARTGRVRGRINLDVTFLNYATSGTAWSGEAYIGVASADPILAGTTLSMAPTCAGSCSATGGFSNRNISTPGAVINATPAYTMTGFTNSQGFGATQWRGTIFNTPGSLTPTLPANFDGANPPQMRCDQGGRGARFSGCVYPAYTPTLVYSRTGNGQLGQHIADAQATGLPGAFGGAPLTRLNTLLDDSNDNRTLACPDRLQRPTGPNGITLDCDEYPFASSKQGAASTNGTNGRTFSYCQIPGVSQTATGPGFSSCMIDRTANRSGGGQLIGFYNRERVLWDDAFHVDVDP